MKNLKSALIAAIALSSALLTACTNDELKENVQQKDKTKVIDFVATLSADQKQNIEQTGSAFLVTQQKDAWHDMIDPEIPATWGTFTDPRKQTRSNGIYGSYPAQYWTMMRVKIGSVPNDVRKCIVLAIKEIESKTNVRFYNSINDKEYYEQGSIKIKLPNIHIDVDNNNNIEGSGSYGLVGGEQYIYVPSSLNTTNANPKEIKRFFIHALCNAAGMFNEQQRKDRDDYVTINWNNIKDNCKPAFNKQDKNFIMFGTFDYHSVTLASSKAYSKNGSNTILKKGGGEIAVNYTLSEGDRAFLNKFYLPMIARTDNYIELDTVVYDGNNVKLTESQRLQLQTQINQQRGLYGNPPASGRKTDLVPW